MVPLNEMGMFLALTMLLYTGAALLLCAARCLRFERRRHRHAQRHVKQQMITEKVTAAIAAVTQEASAPRPPLQPLGRGEAGSRPRPKRSRDHSYSPSRRRDRPKSPARAKSPFEMDRAHAERWGFKFTDPDEGAARDADGWLRRDLSRADKECWGFGENHLVYNAPLRPSGGRGGALVKKVDANKYACFGRELDRADTDSWGLGGSLSRLPGTTRLSG